MLVKDKTNTIFSVELSFRESLTFYRCMPSSAHVNHKIMHIRDVQCNTEGH